MKNRRGVLNICRLSQALLLLHNMRLLTLGVQLVVLVLQVDHGQVNTNESIQGGEHLRMRSR